MKDIAQGCADHLMLAQIKPVNISYAYNRTSIFGMYRRYKDFKDEHLFQSCLKSTVFTDDHAVKVQSCLEKV